MDAKRPQIADLWQNILKQNDRALMHFALHIEVKTMYLSAKPHVAAH